MTKRSVVSFLWLHKMNVCQIYPMNNTVWILLYRYLPSWYIKCAYFPLTFKCIVYNMNNVALYLKGACCCLVLIPFSQFFNALLKKIFGRYQYYNQISRNISPLSKTSEILYKRKDINVFLYIKVHMSQWILSQTENSLILLWIWTIISYSGSWPMRKKIEHYLFYNDL